MAIVGLILLLAALVLWRILRDGLHPAVVMPSVWGVTLVLVQIAQPFGFFPVAPASLLLFLSGLLIFSAGACLGSRLAAEIGPRTAPLAERLQVNYRALAICALLIHVVMLPLWLSEIQAIAGDTDDILVIAYQLRIKSVYDEVTTGSLVGNYLVLGMIVIPVLAVGVLSKRLHGGWALLVGAPWVVTNLLTNGRSTLVQLVLALIYFRLMLGPRITLKTAMTLAGMFLLVFGGGAVLVGKGGIDESVSVGEVAELIMLNFFDYALQGPILFSAYFENPTLVTPSWDPFRVPCLALERFGLCEPGPLHQDFLFFGTGDRIGNVYSIFFSTYPKYGLLGTALILCFCGAWAAFHHQRFRQDGRLYHAVLAGFLFGAVVLSIFLDSFLPLLNFVIKTWLVCVLIPRIFRTKRETAGPDAGH